jgi:hypothetical protein
MFVLIMNMIKIIDATKCLTRTSIIRLNKYTPKALCIAFIGVLFLALLGSIRPQEFLAIKSILALLGGCIIGAWISVELGMENE